MEQDFINKKEKVYLDRSYIAPIFYIFKIFMDKMNIIEFLKYTKNHPKEFINYCEVIITRGGLIFLAEPSHVESIISYICDKLNISKQDIQKELPEECLPIEWLVDKYGLVAVWRSGYMHSSKGLSPRQKYALRLLEKNNLIDKKETSYIDEACAYSNYLYRNGA